MFIEDAYDKGQFNDKNNLSYHSLKKRKNSFKDEKFSCIDIIGNIIPFKAK